jgi:hypothetical protein
MLNENNDELEWNGACQLLLYPDAIEYTGRAKQYQRRTQIRITDAYKEVVPEATHMYMSRHQHAGKLHTIKTVNKFYAKITN